MYVYKTNFKIKFKSRAQSWDLNYGSCQFRKTKIYVKTVWNLLKNVSFGMAQHRTVINDQDTKYVLFIFLWFKVDFVVTECWSFVGEFVIFSLSILDATPTFGAVLGSMVVVIFAGKSEKSF